MAELRWKRVDKNVVVMNIPVSFSKSQITRIDRDCTTARILRKESEAAKLKNVVDKYTEDLGYRYLHDGLADLFAKLLKLDVGYLSIGELIKISLTAKWCPSVNRSYDKSKLICGNMTKRMFGKELFEEIRDVAKLRCDRMLEGMKKTGNLDSCIAVFDVSRSMAGIPMKVLVAFGWLFSKLSKELWKGNVITFSANPQLCVIKGDNLKEKTEFIRNMDWGYNTDWQGVFDRWLEAAVNGMLSEEQMRKRVFIFRDKELDEVNNTNGAANDIMTQSGANNKVLWKHMLAARDHLKISGSRDAQVP